MNDRLEIIVLNRPGEVFLPFIDIESTMRFFYRTGHLRNYSIFAHKGKHLLFVDKIDDVNDLMKKLNELAVRTD
jgi:hypothetical protein